MSRFDDEVLIDSPVDAVWDVYADVERWPQWTASVREVRYLDGDRVVEGARVRIRQPKLMPATWSVVAVEPGRSWTWESRAPGVHTTAVHLLEVIDEHTTRVRQAIVQHGPLAPLVGGLYGRLTRSYLAMEAAGLKQRCEARTHA